MSSLKPGQDSSALGAAERHGGDLVEALLRLAEGIEALRESIPPDSSRASGHRDQDTERLVRGLCESLEESDAENASLRAENERLLAAQEQIAAALRGSETAAAPAPAHAVSATPAGPFELSAENARLRDALGQAKQEAEQAQAMLRAIQGSRAWKLVSLYWSLARRLGRGR